MNGTFSDGSGTGLYSPNANCEWMIAASGDLLVTLVFTEFSTQPGKDLVRVFQCTDIGCSEQQLLAELSGTYSSAQAVTSASGYMKVVFTSDGSVNYDGFNATWNMVQPFILTSFHIIRLVPL
jgi:hypothetical protein